MLHDALWQSAMGGGRLRSSRSRAAIRAARPGRQELRLHHLRHAGPL